MKHINAVNQARKPFVLGGSLLLALCGCAAQNNEPGGEGIDTVPTATVQSALDASDCNTANPGSGWDNHAIPASTGVFSASWRTYPSDHSIDGVMGFSNGPARAFTDLGPIARFAPSSLIDFRDGSNYDGGVGYSYTGGVGPFEFQLRVDVPAHRYSAWIRHLDALYKPFELLAQDLAFRTEQSSVPRLDNWGSFVDSTTGVIQSCHFQYNPTNGCVQSKNDGVWQSRPFDDRLSQNTAHVELSAWVDASNVDGVIGVASGAPTAFNQLAAIVRFRPDGRMDARNGGAYAADAELTYVPNTYYIISMALDLTRHTYSVSVRPAADQSGVGTELAHDYAFRTEQAGSTNVDHVAQFVDGTPGSLNTCAMQAL
jgi:hypothetical protein